MMKTSTPLPITDISSESPGAAAGAPADLIHTEFTPGTARILLAIEVPLSAVPAIEADWALVAEAQAAAPDLAPTVVADALGRLHQRALNVSGVALAKRVRNPFARWMRHAA